MAMIDAYYHNVVDAHRIVLRFTADRDMAKLDAKCQKILDDHRNDLLNKMNLKMEKEKLYLQKKMNLKQKKVKRQNHVILQEVDDDAPPPLPLKRCGPRLIHQEVDDDDPPPLSLKMKKSGPRHILQEVDDDAPPPLPLKRCGPRLILQDVDDDDPPPLSLKMKKSGPRHKIENSPVTNNEPDHVE